MKTPVLLIAFNRPEYTQRVFDEIKKAEPDALYFAIDGPRDSRRDEDVVNIEQVKALLKQVDWSCSVHTRFSETNQGCGFGPANAISWAFETCERLVILEDDCVPVPSFWTYCEQMLDRYSSDKRVWLISGWSRWHDSKYFGDADYLFSNYAPTVGWATWKDRWQENDIQMSDYLDFQKCGGFKNSFHSKIEARFYNKAYNKRFKYINREISHSWDAQWMYTWLKNNAFGIVPRYHLINNIGEQGTHSKGVTSDNLMKTSNMPEVIRHPKFVLINKAYEEMYFRKTIQINSNILVRVIRRLYLIMYSLIVRLLRK